MPLAGFVFIFNVGGIAWDVLFGGNSLGSSKGCGLTRKRLREDIVELICPAAVVSYYSVMDFWP